MTEEKSEEYLKIYRELSDAYRYYGSKLTKQAIICGIFIIGFVSMTLLIFLVKNLAFDIAICICSIILSIISGRYTKRAKKVNETLRVRIELLENDWAKVKEDLGI